MQEQIVGIKDTVERIEQKLENKYVSKEEFAPIKRLVYGCVSIILSSVVLALVALIIK
jgi:thiosulfate reductase cytochrome b subunit